MIEATAFRDALCGAPVKESLGIGHGRSCYRICPGNASGKALSAPGAR